MSKKRLYLTTILLVFILFSIFLVNTNKKEDKYSNTYYNLGTINEITLYDIRKNDAYKILNQCESILLDIDNKMSSQINSSEISDINKNAGIKYVNVSDDTYQVIKESLYFSNISHNAFDISIGPILDLWSIGTDNARVPSSQDIQNKLDLVNYNNILLDDKSKSIKLSKENMKINLGAIAKGYAADKIVIYLKENNIQNALINLGGNIYTLGKNSNNKLFSIGIQDPSKPRGNSIGSLKVSNKSVVTSGIYERYLEHNNKIYHHMINPTTGYPFENNLSSVTIISDESLTCDALSTTVFGLGLNKGLDLVNTLQEVDAIFITNDKKIYLSDNIKYEFKLIDDEFTIVNKRTS